MFFSGRRESERYLIQVFLLRIFRSILIQGPRENGVFFLFGTVNKQHGAKRCGREIMLLIRMVRLF